MSQPAYSLDEFVKDCKHGKKRVFIWKCAVETASIDFNLNSETAVLEFIGNGGLEDPEHQNTNEWRDNPNKSMKIDIDTYRFKTGERKGYIAFFLQPQTNMWTVKSFKKDTQGSPRNLALGGLKELMENFGKNNLLKGGSNE